MYDDMKYLSPTLYLEEKKFGGKDIFLANGYDRLTSMLAKEVHDIRLNTSVRKVDYQGAKIHIAINNGSIEADYVLVTASIGILQRRAIEFSPGLPVKKLEAIDAIGFNCMNKYIVAFEKPFWDDTEQIFLATDKKNKFNLFVNLHNVDKKQVALLAFACSDEARETENQTDEQVLNDILSNLRIMYGDKVTTPTYFNRTKWGQDPISYGSYSYPSSNTKRHHYDDITEDVSSKIFFAGEHTTIEYMGCAHGAYLSGFREADKIIALQQ